MPSITGIALRTSTNAPSVGRSILAATRCAPKVPENYVVASTNDTESAAKASCAPNATDVKAAR